MRNVLRRWAGDEARSGHNRKGFGTRPAQLDCAYEAICENCTFFQTSIEFRPTLKAQHDDAAAKNQDDRTALFSRLLTDLDDTAAS